MTKDPSATLDEPDTDCEVIGKMRAEIARLQEAKRRALAVADERAIEANGVRAENERLREENAALTDGLMAYWGNLFDSRLKYVLETRRRVTAEQEARERSDGAI